MPEDIEERFRAVRLVVRSRLEYSPGEGPTSHEQVAAIAREFETNLAQSLARFFRNSRVHCRQIYARHGSAFAGHFVELGFPAGSWDDWQLCQRMFSDFADDMEAWVLAEWQMQEGPKLIWGRIQIRSVADDTDLPKSPPNTQSAASTVDIKDLIDRRDRMVWTVAGVAGVLGLLAGAALVLLQVLFSEMQWLRSREPNCASSCGQEIASEVAAPPSAEAVVIQRPAAIIREEPECLDCPVVRRVQRSVGHD